MWSIINVIQVDAVLSGGGGLDLVATMSNGGHQEDLHSLTKKHQVSDRKGLTIRSLVIDHEVGVSVENTMVRTGLLKVSLLGEVLCHCLVVSLSMMRARHPISPS